MDLSKALSKHNFFQQVRAMLGQLKKSGSIKPRQLLEDQLYFVSPLSLEAQRGEVGPIKPLAGNRWQVQVSSHGLTGAMGALPTTYTEWLIERYYRYGDTAAKAFFDIFNHRLQCLRYLAWQKYHFYAQAEFDAAMPLSTAIRGLSGFSEGEPSLQKERVATLFAHSVRSMVNLETWLKTLYGVPVKITPFTGGWRKMAPSFCSRLGGHGQTLGEAPMIGSVYWDRQSHFTVTLGPIPMPTACLFLPEGPSYDSLLQHIQEFVGAGLDFDIDLLIQHAGTPRTLLGTGRLGLDISLGNSAELGKHKIRLPARREGR
ncbi:type VI secretion system baseplate subunit TssG [Yersinia enterocolitica]|uniref:type VI secretion system baseplate subunit TssG n=1 Tax=Yersinia TaxID=629 RepID=UPI00094B9D46|nr:type VI secretion system baseplate subunit TssG [Yersinia enterocolitica]EKN4037487.1 type VI secretion system baseplate subunit TssG [Yersinia enterocolitica]OWF82263.1 type VI secretion protein [Yersinia kristensenii]